MSWLRLDDGMLDHPKWIQALKLGGDAALHLWLRLCAWSSRNLTDGRIPAHVLDAIPGPRGDMTRRRAWQALTESGLIVRHVNGDVLLHDYLDYQPSRAKLLSDRSRRAQSEQGRRDANRVAGHDRDPVPDRGRVPSRPVPSPSLSDESERDTRALEVEEVPGLEIVHPGPLQPSKRERRLDAQALALNRLMHKYPSDFDPTKANQARGHELGLSDEEIWQRWFECKDKPYPHGFDDPEAQFNRELAWAKSDKEKRLFKTKSERDAFEMPGRERRAT